ncbi:MAG: metallophosphoesterase family protein [Desulfobacterales bacterium]|jgi:putative phosphoesterase
MPLKLKPQNSYLIGVISDTHGHIPSGIPNAFKNIDLIIHAGDIGDKKVFDKLSKIAPVVAVRGNMDFGKWAGQLPEAEIIEIGPIVLVVLHIVNRLDADPAKAGFKAVISGHTHRPEIYEKNGITFINPGSASYPKFGQPASAALIQIKWDRLDVNIIHLKD